MKLMIYTFRKVGSGYLQSISFTSPRFHYNMAEICCKCNFKEESEESGYLIQIVRRVQTLTDML